MDEAQKSQYAFEDAVRATARMLWNEAALDGAGKLDERERDGIFETRDTIHLVEATTSTKLYKASDDAKKTHESVLRIRRSGSKFAQGWLITQQEPTADQRDLVKSKYSSTTTIMSFDQFRSRLFNGNEYLRARTIHRFGSIQDFADDTVHVAENEFVPTDFLDVDRTYSVPHADVLSKNPSGARQLILMLGEYGSGKSMSLRGAFIARRKAYFDGAMRCPIYLNLREHTGQTSPVEALERHARIIGYSGPANDLVRAWRAGFVDLILDGFDEMATAGWGGALKKVRHHRFAGMALVRGFLAESPTSVDVYVAGRENFFDSMTEMKQALGVGDGFRIVRTSEFGSEELATFLKRKKFSGHFPSWLPARPLLISYLLAKGLLVAETLEDQLDEATGWDHLLDMISAREAAQDSRLDPGVVRRLIERLATLARSTVDGLGTLDVTAIQEAFQREAGFAPDEGSAQLLLRLPGLAPSSREDGTRRFVDTSLASAAKAGDVVRFIQHPYDEDAETFIGVISGIGDLGKAVLAIKLSAANVTAPQVLRALQIAASSEEISQICAEILSAFLGIGDDVTLGPINVRSMSEDELTLAVGDVSLSSFTFTECLFTTVNLEQDYPAANLPKFKDCIIGAVTGIVSRQSIPPQFEGSEIAELSDEVMTNAQLFAAALPETQKVLISILRKLFLQSGAGRQESAFYRGSMDARSKALVPEVLEKVHAAGFAEPTRLRGKKVWHPNRALSSDARRIIFSPSSDHPLVKAVLDI
ncbi:MAG: hypothetical protein ABL866_11665 [Devosia sp.]